MEVKIPSSLRNIYKELLTDINEFKSPKHGHLLKWVNQGVFLLNSALTVQDGKAGSHLKAGWQNFTDVVLQYINNKYESNIDIGHDTDDYLSKIISNTTDELDINFIKIMI